MYNKVILVGNLTRDMELRYTQSGSAIAKSAIATSRRYNVGTERREEVCFVDITFFGRSAEIANQYLRKGSKVLIEGRLIFEQWVDQQGSKRSKHSVTVENMQMLDTRADSARAADTQGFQSRQPYPSSPQTSAYTPPPSHTAPESAAPRELPNNDAIPEIDVDEDEIPF